MPTSPIYILLRRLKPNESLLLLLSTLRYVNKKAIKILKVKIQGKNLCLKTKIRTKLFFLQIKQHTKTAISVISTSNVLSEKNSNKTFQVGMTPLC